ncbi:MAG: hypothetical protein ACOC5B_00740 [Myxococcota bacterium]
MVVEGSEDTGIKGTAIREFLAWYARTRGETTVRRVIEDLPRDVRSWFDPEHEALGVLASTWYPARAIHALLDAMTTGMTVDERERFAAEGGETVMRNTLSGIYRALFRVIANPDRYAKMAPKVWHTYYRSGQLTVERPGEGRAVSHIRDWGSHHPVICEMHRAAARVIYEGMGCRDVSVTREACVSRGDDECRFATRWRA